MNVVNEITNSPGKGRSFSSSPSFYFPIAEISLLIPLSLPNGTTLLRTQVQPMGARTRSPKVTYQLLGRAPPWLKITTEKQELVIGITSNSLLSSEIFRVVIEARGESRRREIPNEEKLRQMVLNLKVVDSKNENICGLENATRTICFWPAIHIRALEEMAGVDVAPTGPTYLQRFCSQQFQYTIEKVSDYLSGLTTAVDSSGIWRLQTALPLDREAAREQSGEKSPTAASPLPRANVICSGGSQGEEKGVAAEEVEALETLAGPRTRATWEAVVELIDRDDNPPKPYASHQRVYLNTNHVVKDTPFAKTELLMQDPDSSVLQRFQGYVLEDALGLWKVQCDPAKELTHSWDFRHSSSTCYLIPKENRTLPENYEYNVTLLVNDTTMEHLRPGDDSHVQFSLTLVAGAAPIATTTTSPTASLAAWSAPYPRNVVLPRWAAPLARVARAVPPPSAATSATGGSAMTEFSLEAADVGDSLAITPEKGIVYVNDSFALEEAPENFTANVTWRWTNGSVDTWQLRVRLSTRSRTSSNSNPCTRLERLDELSHCADFSSAQQCTAHCGLGVGAARTLGRKGAENVRFNVACSWRSTGPSQPHAHANYSTCTPDTATCPDGECDELENNNPFLCPQDCVAHDPNSAHISYNAHGRGIASAPGVCTCSTGRNCLCLHDPPAPLPAPTQAPTQQPSSLLPPHVLHAAPPNAVPLGRSLPCGAACRLALVAGSALLLGGTAGLIFWRYRVSGKGRCARKLTTPSAAAAALEAARPRPSASEAAAAPEMQPLSMPFTNTIAAPDPRWEFPRKQLVLEQPLGEGEFGQVLRARALNIAGRSGWTTVAVKTLKAGAGASELADLLSEFSLLRGVAHPNVVRLLGACAAGCAAGEPFLLVMEFAEHGSLRTYLRRSRHAQSDGALPCSAPPDGPPPSPSAAPSIARVAPHAVAPRDVLAFAWQISKGMTYLSDIKLIHRDLAARNVLVAEGGICKISDFGLTRDVYEDDTYLKRSKGRVPVKWMSLESLADHMYTSKSDVWSFGVLLWELVTLGASPYPGVAVHNLFHLLKAGYRMQRPENCSLALYRIMRSCWHENPDERPSFKELTAIFERMLEDGVDYLDLNPRTVHNMTYFTSLSSSRDMLDDSDTHYGNLNILSTDSVNYLTTRQPRRQANSSIVLTKSPTQEEEEARLLPTPSDATSEDFVDIQKSLILEDHETEDLDSSRRQGNAYLSPIRMGSPPRESSRSPLPVPLTQRYISLSLTDSRQSPRNRSHESVPGTSNVTAF